MKEQFEIWKTNRIQYISILNKLSIQDMNNIPQGFNNNIVWNIGHVIAIQQVLIYKRSDLEMFISDDFYSNYKSGSKPEKLVTEKEINQIKSLLESTIDSTISDFNDEKFKSYNELTTSTQFHLNTFSKAVEFNNYHEGLHLGAIKSLKKMILLQNK